MFCQSGNLEDLRTHSLMRRALDLLPDGVLIVGRDREVLYLNAAFERLWRIPRDIVRQGDGAMLRFVMQQLEDPDGFFDMVERLYSLRDSTEGQIAFKDGRVFIRRSVALDAGNGGSTRIWIFSDITEARSAKIGPLTGLSNRRAYMRELPNFMASMLRGQLKAFALFDADCFKLYNDLYGHAAGDAALEALGQQVKHVISDGAGRVYRIGGEEFALTSVHADRVSATRFHEALLKVVREAATPHAGNRPHGVFTISIGLALFRGKSNLDEIFAEADRALYRAKNRGRNRTVAIDLDKGTTLMTA